MLVNIRQAEDRYRRPSETVLPADVLELKANLDTFCLRQRPRGQARQGPRARLVLVTRGTLHRVIRWSPALPTAVRAMLDPKGRAVTEAGPSDAVEILGLQSVPNAGDRVPRVRGRARPPTSVRSRPVSSRAASSTPLENLFRFIADAEVKELNLDHQGRRPGFHRGPSGFARQDGSVRGPHRTIHLVES